MRNAKLLTNEELAKELDAFYAFVRIFGYGYLNEKGLIYFNYLRGESCIRVQNAISSSIEIAQEQAQ